VYETPAGLSWQPVPDTQAHVLSEECVWVGTSGLVALRSQDVVGSYRRTRCSDVGRGRRWRLGCGWAAADSEGTHRRRGSRLQCSRSLLDARLSGVGNR